MNAPVPYPTMHHFVIEMCTYVTKCCIVGCVCAIHYSEIRITGLLWRESTQLPVTLRPVTRKAFSRDPYKNAWWRHEMETLSAKLALCAGNSPVPVNSPHKAQWRGALMFSLICVWINGWVNNREAGDWRRHRGHYDVNVMSAVSRQHQCRIFAPKMT